MAKLSTPGGSDQNAEAVIDLIVRKYHLGIDRDPYIGIQKTYINYTYINYVLLSQLI